MIDNSTAAPIVELALGRLGISEELRPLLFERIQMVSFAASFRPPPAGHRISPQDISDALKRVENGMREVAAGLATIDDARATVTPGAVHRADSLEQVQHGMLGAIAEAVISALSANEITDDRLADTMPSYGYLSWTNRWNGVFFTASKRISALREAYSQADFRAPTRDREEWFSRAIAGLAEIYFDATGKPAKAYSRGGNTTPGWRAPFAQFVEDLWPLFALGREPPPSDKKVADALSDTTNLPPVGATE